MRRAEPVDYKDYYKLLGVDRKADEKQIKAAFRRLARKHHPDVNPDDKQAESRFKEINEAYEVLGDPEKRRRYDQLGAHWQQWQRSGGRPGDFDWTQWMGGAPSGAGRRATADDLRDIFGDSSPFSDFFTSIFGGASSARRRGGFDPGIFGGGQDVETELEISLAEAYTGAMRQLSVDGKRLKVRIPAGAATGTRVRVRGEGGQGRSGGPRGHLYLKVRVSPDHRFERKGDDLHTVVPISLCTAVLGGEITIPTLESEVTLKVAAGSQNGQLLRVRGRGMPKLSDPKQHGHLYARLQVVLPRKLNERQRELFEQLRETGLGDD
jgi:curved DNA-binding protein